MLKKALTVLFSTGLALVAIGYVLYLGNSAPIAPPVAAADLENPARPYVIKLHARWCPVCMVTKGVWGEIEKSYTGRVNLVVFDSTTAADTAASRAEAKRLGLESFFEEYEGSTGLVVVLSARREVLASIKGSRDFSHYRAAIDAALGPSAEPQP